MRTPQSFASRTSILSMILLLAVVFLGWLLPTKPLSSTAHPVMHYRRLAVSFALAAQNPDSEMSSFLSNLCLQPLNESRAQGAAIVQQPCNSRQAQQWSAVPVSGDVVHYVNQLSGLCLDARGGAANRTPVQQWTCNKISNENWEPTPYVSDEVPAVYSRVSGTKSFCLDVPGGSSAAGLAMQIYRCNGTAAQLWWTP